MVKQGYKQTEIGVIPEEWKTFLFKNCFDILPNNTLSRAELNNNCGTVKNIHYGDILVKYNSILDCSNIEIPYINNAKKSFSSMCLEDGDIVIADTAEDETVGKAVEISNVDNQKIVAGLHTIPCRVINKEDFSAGWLGYYINYDIYHHQLLPYITGTKVSAISKSAISNTVILIPPKKEQQCIANALSDVDGMISSLEKLIAKKKSVKQGAMQELLIGKKRLPGFTGEWETHKLCECTERVIVGLATSVTQYYKETGTVIFRNLNILPNKLDDSDILFLDSDFANSCPNKKIKTDDVLTVHTGYVGISCIVPEKYDGAITFTTLITTTKKNILNPQYLMIHLNSEIGAKAIEALQAGGGRNNLNVSDFKQYEMCFPKDIDEQKAIASILLGMDSEIESLERKLAKTRQLKQGMMQQLLTGKMRLV